MESRQLLLALVERTRRDFVSYFADTPNAEVAEQLIDTVLANPKGALRERQQLEFLIPDTEDDGSLEASYALNAGVIVTLFVDFAITGSQTCVDEAATLLLDTAYFKAGAALEASGVPEPTDVQMKEHLIFVREKQWLENLAERPGA